MFRRTLQRLKMVFGNHHFSIPIFATFVIGALYCFSYGIQCLLVDTPVRTIHLEVPADAEVRAETSVTSNAFLINVESVEWQTLYKNRQEGSHPIVVVRHNGIESWLPRWGGVLHHSVVEKPMFATAHVQSFWNVGVVERVSDNEYCVTATKDWAVFFCACFGAFFSGLISFLIFSEEGYSWSRTWNRSLHHVT